MKKFIENNRNGIIGATACLFLAVLTLSFQDTPYVKAILDNQQPQDTTPVKKKKSTLTMKEFDKLSAELDKQVLDELKQVDLEKIQQEALASLKELDMDKIMREVDASLKKADMEKAMAEVTASLKNIDPDKLNDETKESLANAQQELEKATAEIKNIDKDVIKQQLEQARMEVEKSQSEIKKTDMEKVMQEARTGMNKAKAELKQLKEMFTEMEQDGLINSKKGFKIAYKDKTLFINGTKQSEQVTDKYRKYFKDEHTEITIDKE